jgi:hypothetical protein
MLLHLVPRRWRRKHAAEMEEIFVYRLEMARRAARVDAMVSLRSD